MSSDQKYDWTDPPKEKIDEVLKEWPNSASLMLGYVRDLFPGWITTVAKQYSIDLSKFNTQWAAVCVQLGCRPMKVLIVADTFLKERGVKGHKYTLMDEAIKRLTENGYVIMGKDIFGVCTQCNEVIVSQDRMKENKLSFSGKCQRCFPYDPRKPL